MKWKQGTSNDPLSAKPFVGSIYDEDGVLVATVVPCPGDPITCTEQLQHAAMIAKLPELLEEHGKVLQNANDLLGHVKTLKAKIAELEAKPKKRKR